MAEMSARAAARAAAAVGDALFGDDEPPLTQGRGEHGEDEESPGGNHDPASPRHASVSYAPIITMSPCGKWMSTRMPYTLV